LRCFEGDGASWISPPCKLDLTRFRGLACRRIVGWAMEQLKAELILTALEKSLAQRCPEGDSTSNQNFRSRICTFNVRLLMNNTRLVHHD